MLRIARVSRVFTRTALLDLSPNVRVLARMADRLNEGDAVVVWVRQGSWCGWGAVRVYPTALLLLASFAVWVCQ